MELTEAMRTTGAARAFTEDEVPDAVLRRILDNARYAPSGGNRQPWRVVVIKDEALRLAIRDAYVAGWREYVAHAASGLVPFAPGEDGRWDGPAVDLEQARAMPSPNEFADHLNEVPVMLVLLAHLPSLAVTDNGLDRQSIVGGASVYPFSHNLLLAARQEGLGGVMTTVICREEQVVKRLLAVPREYAVAGLIVLGRPVHQVTKLRRRGVDEFATIDRVGGELLPSDR
ncbi:MAG: nitroreductase family protein [Acidimicrobiales bacterium]|jgi:nitroreductase